MDEKHVENGTKTDSTDTSQASSGDHGSGTCQNTEATAVSNSSSSGQAETRVRSNSNLSGQSGESDEGKSILRKKAVNGNDSGSDTDSYRLHEEELTRRRSASVLEVKEHANTRLREELMKAQTELMLKDEQCKMLEHVQDQMGAELEELTAKLFEEANKMVQDAHVRRMQSEKLLKEANSKIEVLQAEVTALKTLVLTSTPSMPNIHLHPQLDTKKEKTTTASFFKGHRRSTSHHNLSKELKPVEIPTFPAPIVPPEVKEIEPVYFEEFKQWKQSKPDKINKDCLFLQHVIQQDILPCLSFHNKKLSNQVFEGVFSNTLAIEPIPGEKNPFPKKCVLTETSRVCQYRIRIGDGEPWQIISQLARNRCAAVCDFLTYIRYIIQGLVKSDESGMYWEIVRLRKQMCLARLGYS